MGQHLEDLTDWAEADGWDEAGWEDADGWEDAEGWLEPGVSLVLKEVLREDYGGADDEAYDDALEAVLSGMSAAEAFSFTKALSRLGAGASTALANPVVGQVARTALPVAGGALGTLIGGPAGTGLGSQLGNLAVGALPRPPGAPAAVPARAAMPAAVPAAIPTVVPGVVPPVPPVPPPAVAGAPSPAVAGGSAAAAQGLVLTQQPDVLKALLALSMGQHGARQVGGVPVASVMNMLSSVFGQAAADADEIAYLDGDDAGGDGLDEAEGEPVLGSGRSLYTALLDVENEELAS